MKKLIYYLIFLLALIMMLLASSACRSPKTMTYSKATTDSVSLCVRDSTSQRFEFTFDSLELWGMIRNFENTELRNSQAQPSSEFPNFRSSGISHHIVVYGGKINANITRAMSQDSTSNKSSVVSGTTKIRSGPAYIEIILVVCLIIFLILLYTVRKGALSR